MGRIRTKWVKNMAKVLVEKYPSKFGENFEENKKALESLKIVEDKLMRNKIAGFIISVTRNKKI